MSSYKAMIKVGIVLNSSSRGGMRDIHAKLVLNAVGAKGKTHILFSCAADNFISAIRAQCRVCFVVDKLD